jgi:hypothetical protein
VKVSVSVGRDATVEKFDDHSQSASVPVLVTASVVLAPSLAASPAVDSGTAYGVLTAVAPDSVPSTGPVTVGRFDHVRVDSVQVSDASESVCTSVEPAVASLDVRMPSEAPVSVVPAGAAGSTKRR